MKRLIAAASLAVLATSSAFAVEIGKPFEQLDLDRALPDIPERAASATVYPFGGSAPYEQLAVDRALPNVVVAGERTQRDQYAAAAGETRSDATNAPEERPAASPWDNDSSFAPEN